jgi:uncharacterized protein
MFQQKFWVRFYALIVCTLATFLGFGQSPSAKNPPKAKPQAESFNTLLYEISGNGLKKPSYLFGTMHILCEDDAVLSSNLKQIVRGVDKVYFELDMDNLQEMLGAMKYLQMNGGVKISDLLSKEEYSRLEEFIKKKVPLFPMSMLNRYKPILVSSLLGEQVLECDKKNGMEMVIMKEARIYEKEIKGLESAQFQAGLFDSIPYEKQAKELMKYVDSMDNYVGVTSQLVDVYKKQDLKRMDSLIRVSDPAMDEYMDLLLYGRNRRWVNFMPGFMAGQSILFAVGAGHLPGQEGVINLLRKKGFTVKPLKNDFPVRSQESAVGSE